MFVSVLAAAFFMLSPARAEPVIRYSKEQVAAETKTVIDATGDLKSVRDHAWVQIPATSLALPEARAFYLESAKALLDEHASTLLPGLTKELSQSFAGLQFEALHQQSKGKEEIKYCSWIPGNRLDGAIPQTTDLQPQLFAICRSQAREALARLLVGHVDEQRLDLDGAPALDLAYPRWLLADLALDAQQSSAIDLIEDKRAYLDRLLRRLQAAQPRLLQQIDQLHAGHTWDGGAITPPATRCRTVLGPLDVNAAGVDAVFNPLRLLLTNRCMEVERAWLMRVQPGLLAAVAGGAADWPTDAPIRSEQRLCSDVLSRWLTKGGYPAEFHQPVEAGCDEAARKSVARAITMRAEQVAEPLRFLPPTFESLEGQNWYELTAEQVGAMTLPDDPGAQQIGNRIQAAYAMLVAPLAEAAVTGTKRQVRAAYDSAAGSEVRATEARQLCRLGGRTNAAARGSPSITAARNQFLTQVATICSEAERAFKDVRIATAQARSGLTTDDVPPLLLGFDGEKVLVPLRNVVAQAALSGIQIHFTSVRLGFSWSIAATAMGSEQPVLTGSASREGTNLVLDGFDPLPGWPANAESTLVCLTLTETEVQNAQLVSVLTLFSGFIAARDDRPRTADWLIGSGITQLREASGLQACLTARRTFTRQGNG